ncbi:MAG: hypothetical protein KGD74_04680 [Candidatus Lokiarchaeota archaeon]|nr:hypothetical protein [Candidatus Lokiarchaeota archaeon]
MSIHGNQYILPLFNTHSSLQPIKDYDELALSFYLLTKKLKQNEKILSFSRLLWPFLCVQGVISTHIILDGLNIFSKKGKLSNPPRLPLIGHLLRNIENLTKTEQLNKILEALQYKDNDAEALGESEESEFQKLKIDSLTNPEFLQTLVKLLPLAEFKSVAEYMPLETNFTTEQALEIANTYRNTIDYMKGNALRWDTQIELIGKEIDKWLIDINVQLKDIDLRFSSQISKTSRTIDSSQIKDKMALEGDKSDQWKVNEKRNIIENISVLFKTAERNLEEIIKKNKAFTHTDVLKGRVFNDLIAPFENHFKYLIEEGNNFVHSVTSLTENYMALKEKALEIDVEAKKNLEDFSSSLDLKLQDRDKNLSVFEEEKVKKISEIKVLQVSIEDLYSQMKNIIKTKNGNCLQEAKDLISWSLADNESELFSRPIVWIYMPLYVMFIENEERLEEKMVAIYPGFITDDPDNRYKEISGAMFNFKEAVNERIEEDMALRSNFEFSSENRNLLNDQNFRKKIQQGISTLRRSMILSEKMENDLRSKLDSLNTQ